MPPIGPPAADQNAVAPYGIRVPKPAMKAYKLPDAFAQIAADVSTALQDAGIPAVISGTIVVAGSASARDTQWGIPSTAAARLALQNSGAITVRTDTGITERYFAALTDGGTNLGGRPAAGWFPIAANVQRDYYNAAGSGGSQVSGFTFNALTIPRRNIVQRVIVRWTGIITSSAAQQLAINIIPGTGATLVGGGGSLIAVGTTNTSYALEGVVEIAAGTGNQVIGLQIGLSVGGTGAAAGYVSGHLLVVGEW